MPHPQSAAGRAFPADPVVYQIYPRSFCDADGDGDGDLEGVAARLEHVARLGADAVWLSPFYPSPMADGGYDVSDLTGVDPRYGTVADAERMIDRAHELGLRVLLDLVPCHTSIEHPWFRERPELYVWSPHDGPANNWIAAFGGSAWSRDPHGRGWYLHSFYPEQPDLDWRHPEVAELVGEAVRTWRARGADGFRLDAVDRLLKDPGLRDDPRATRPAPLPVAPDHAALEHRHSRNAPDVGAALMALRAAAGPGAWLVGEAYLPAGDLAPYLEHLDAAFAFELYHAPWAPESLRAALRAGLERQGRLAWVTSNHDFPRLATRAAGHARAAALLTLFLPGPVFLYQGDEVGQPDGPGGRPPVDRYGRDAHRHPLRWDATPGGGFSSGAPWLPLPPEEFAVAVQEDDPDSVLWLHRDLVALRDRLAGAAALHPGTAPEVVAVRRGMHLAAVNAGAREAAAPSARALLRHSHRRGETRVPDTLAPGEGFIAALEG